MESDIWFVFNYRRLWKMKQFISNLFLSSSKQSVSNRDTREHGELMQVNFVPHANVKNNDE